MKKYNPSKVFESRTSLTFIFAAFVFLILMITLLFAAGVVYFIDFAAGIEAPIETWHILALMVGISAIMGYSFTLLLSKVVLKPVNTIVDGMNRLAEGDFDARLELSGPFMNTSAAKQLKTSFNRMAEQLGNTELLRADFVNSFSHEFKTPIVSIAGFAKLIRSDSELTPEERDKYLLIIEEESRRLASLATNILNLTKIENQTILTDVSTFNLSEQIRSACLLLESKWSLRGVVPNLDFEEYDISGNAELLKHVWLNLLDNAIKFSEEGGEITVTIHEHKRNLSVFITNQGPEIPKEVRSKIFQKFYQVDESHSSEGSGVGLAVVRRVVDLHSGWVGVESAGGYTTFSVTLPKAQGVKGQSQKSQSQRSQIQRSRGTRGQNEKG